MERNNSFTSGPILGPLIRFSFPVLFAMLLQMFYGAVDLFVVGQFADTVDVSAVSTGTGIMMTFTCIILGLSMGLTILVGQLMGEGKPARVGKAIGSAIFLFALITVLMTAFVCFFAVPVSEIMRAPREAFNETVSYVRLCGLGFIFIVSFNVLGAIFRGIGDSKLPLYAVMIACVFNIFGDLLFVAVFHMGAAGAAIATVAAQAVSVLISLGIIKRRALPFRMSLKDIGFHKKYIYRILALGTPCALQDFLVNISFMFVLAIVNTMGLTASAGVGVAEKLCGFLMLVPSAFSQSMSAFVAQNIGAGKHERAEKTLKYGISISVVAGILMFLTAFCFGDSMSMIFSKEPEVIEASFQYLKAYGIDCLLTSFLFCYIGYFNGYGRTLFSMAQCIIGAFGVRIPVAFFISRIPGVSLFKLGLATPSSSFIQIIICMFYFIYLKKSLREGKIS